MLEKAQLRDKLYIIIKTFQIVCTTLGSSVLSWNTNMLKVAYGIVYSHQHIHIYLFFYVHPTTRSQSND